MVVCRYWKAGNCRNGNSCRFEHPTGQNQGDGNAFGGIGGSRQSCSGSGGVFGNLNRPERWQINEDEVRNDLTTTRPKWILSAYGPGKEPPASLFPDNEYSAEEVRWRFYQAQAAGQADVADREAISVWQKADASMREVASKVNEVQKYMESKEKEHPNRYDFADSLKFNGSTSAEEFTKQSQHNAQPGSSLSPWKAAPNAAATTNPFSRPALGESSKLSPFGQPAQSTFGQRSQGSAFGQPAFGQPAQTSAFGQSSPVSAFGRAVQPSASSQPAFGQATQPSAFGKPPQPAAFGRTGFGQAGPGTSPFGTAGASNTSFGQPSGLGQNNTTSTFAKAAPAAGFGAGSGFASNAFGSTTTAAFGQAAASNPFAKAPVAAGFGAGSGFGNVTGPSPFAQKPAQSASQSPFGQPLTAGTSQPTFGQQSTSGKTASAFGNAINQSVSPFAQNTSQISNTSPFGTGANDTKASPFGGTSGQSQSFGNNPFAQSQQSTAQQQPKQNPFGQPSQNNGFGQPSTTFGTNSFSSGLQQSAASQQNAPQSTTTQAQAFAPSGPQQTAAAAASSAQPTTKPTNKPTVPLVYSSTLPNGTTRVGPDNKLSTYKGFPVQYDIKMKPTVTGEEVVDVEIPCYRRPDGKGLEKVWYPQANADPGVQRLTNKLEDIQAEEASYTPEIIRQYAHLYENGRFDQGKLPLVPPMHGWIDYNF